jgi:antitoxin HicB
MDFTFAYPVRFERAEEGGWVITCRDLPEVVSQAEDDEDRIDIAEGALQAAFESRIMLKEPIPRPSPKRAGEEVVSVPIETATKAALHLAASDVSKSEIARKLGVNEKEVRRLMDPAHASKVPRMAEVVAALGKRMRITLVDVHPHVDTSAAIAVVHKEAGVSVRGMKVKFRDTTSRSEVKRDHRHKPRLVTRKQSARGKSAS